MEDYRFVEKIGRGTHGTAYLLKSHDGYVVCKSVIAKHLGRARQEIAVLSRLSHRRVVRKLDSIQTNGSMFIILEYANYGTLEKMMQYFVRGGVVPGAALGWSLISQISDALYYVHSRRIVHRDVKPANILINRFWVRGGEYLEFKLCDFSLSASLEHHGDLISDGATVGTPFYMAPEMVAGQPYGSGVDVWGLGVVLYEALRLQKPFRGHTRGDLYAEIASKEIACDGICTDAPLSALVHSCLSRTGRPSARTVAKNERVRLNLTMLELKYRERRIEALEEKLREYEDGARKNTETAFIDN